MFSVYKDIQDVPVLELRMEALARDVGPERFWNGSDPILTNLFNVFNLLDEHGLRFVIETLERVCAMQTDMPKDLLQHTQMYIDNLKKCLLNLDEHIELMRQLGYETTMPDSVHFKQMQQIPDLSIQELLALANVYSWLTYSVNGYILSQAWYLASAIAKPAAIFRWRLVIENLHRGLLPALLEHYNVSTEQRNAAWWSLSWQGNRFFAHAYFRLLRSDGAFALGKLPNTLDMFYKMFMHPVRGFHRHAWKIMRLYRKHNGDSRYLPIDQVLDDVLLNAQVYIAQVNPAVDNTVFFSGRYFQNLYQRDT